MKVLHVLTTDQRRGAETSALVLLEQLASRGHDCRAVALSGGTSENRHAVEVLPGRSRTALRSLVALRRAASWADVVLAHGSTTLTACGVALVGRGAPPFVYANIGDPLFWADDRLRRLRVRFLLARAAKVAALSEKSRRVLIDAFGVPEANLAVITNGRDAEHFVPPEPRARRAARERFGVSGAQTVVGVIGALSPEKRVDVAIEAVGRLPCAVLLVAGGGPLRADLERVAATEAPGRVRFLGQVADVREVLAGIDVLLLSSDSEGLPGVLIEAGLSGVPAVATDVGFVEDVVLTGRTGLLVAAGDAVAAAAALRRVAEHRDAWGRAARAHCEQGFTLGRTVQRWERLLEQALLDRAAPVEGGADRRRPPPAGR